MSMTLTQNQMDHAALVLVVDEHGLFEWSSTKSARQVATHLRALAKIIQQEAAP